MILEGYPADTLDFWFWPSYDLDQLTLTPYHDLNIFFLQQQTMNTEQSELKDEKYLFAFSFFARMLQQSRGRVYGKEDTTSQSAVR